MRALFSIGDKVVCVNSKDQEGRLIEGKIYTVLGLFKCCDYGIDVGLPQGAGYCGICGALCTDNRAYFNQRRFVPVETDRALEEEIFEALKGQKILN